MITCKSVMLGTDSSSIYTNMIPILFDMTPTCKAKAAIRKFRKLENKKLISQTRSGILFLESISQTGALNMPDFHTLK
jgi:hypothetical protein